MKLRGNQLIVSESDLGYVHTVVLKVESLLGEHMTGEEIHFLMRLRCCSVGKLVACHTRVGSNPWFPLVRCCMLTIIRPCSFHFTVKEQLYVRECLSFSMPFCRFVLIVLSKAGLLFTYSSACLIWLQELCNGRTPLVLFFAVLR